MPNRQIVSHSQKFGVVGFVVLVVLVSVAWPGGAAAGESAESPWFRAEITGELGFLDVLSHRAQFSRDGTYFDYVDEGGQDVLFNFKRLSARLDFGPRHSATFLYQPLRIETEVTMRRDVTVDGLTFPEGRPVDVTYGFPFYRASYVYDLAPAPDRRIGVGASLQLRNATLAFTSSDGQLRRSNRNVGPVPILKSVGRIPLPDEFWFGWEVDGFYAPVSYLNGDDNDVEGAILDASLRAGRPLSDRIEVFANLRYLGGGSEGENDDDTGPGDGYTRNWLHFATVSLGFTWTVAGAGG